MLIATRRKNLVFAIFAGLLLASHASALPLAPGNVLSGVSLAGPGREGGDQVASVIDSFTAPGAFGGDYITAVIDEESGNSLGGLTFLYQFLNGASSTNSIGRIALSGFDSIQLEVNYDNDGTGVAPAVASRDPNGDVVGFNFLPLDSNPATGFLSPGTGSRILVVRTSATEYAFNGVAALIDGGGTTVPIFAPVPVPEPSSLALLALGAVGIVARRRMVRR